MKKYRYDLFYRLKREYVDPYYGVPYPLGAAIRVHDWNDINVQISMCGELMWVSHDTFRDMTH